VSGTLSARRLQRASAEGSAKNLLGMLRQWFDSNIGFASGSERAKSRYNGNLFANILEE
jgi:hypothetical protein